jgi:hypothetical protein
MSVIKYDIELEVYIIITLSIFIISNVYLIWLSMTILNVACNVVSVNSQSDFIKLTLPSLIIPLFLKCIVYLCF